MSIAAELLQRHIQTLVDDHQQWQTLIADDGRRGHARGRPRVGLAGQGWT